MTLTYEVFKDRIVEIENQIDSTSQYYAKVLRWKNMPGDRYHYGIGLGDFTICSLEEDLSIIERHQVDAIIDTHLDPVFTKAVIIERLKFALRWLRDCEKFSYNLQYLNDEHLVNLIVTDLAKTRNHLDATHRNKAAEQNFRAYLANEALNLQKEKKFSLIWKASTWTYFFCFIIPFIATFFLPETKDNPYITAIICGIIGILIAYLLLRISSLNWSGFYDKRLWDWLGLLIVPFFLALGAFYIEGQADDRNEETLNQSRERQIISTYIEEMNDLVVKNETNSNLPSVPTHKKELAQAMTINLLDEISPIRKSKMITFLSDSFLIRCEGNLHTKCDPTIHLEGVNLYGIELSNLELPKVNLKKANLSKAKLKNIILNNANLRSSKFNRAQLVKVSFVNADLRHADLRDAQFLENTNLRDAKLSNANLSGADLSGTIDLEFATLKDACYDSKTTVFPDNFTKDDIKKLGLREISKNQYCEN